MRGPGWSARYGWQFDYAKLRWWGLQKNAVCLAMLLALGNLWMARMRIMERLRNAKAVLWA